MQTGGSLELLILISLGGQLILLEVSMSLRFGSFLYPMSGLLGKICCRSSVFLMIFQLFRIICEILGFLGL